MQFLSDPILVVAVVEVLLGVALLTKSADTFVDGAANVAAAAKVSPVLVGAVIVGFGTSAPELLVSGIAAYNGDLDLGLGNIIGSNVANISLVLGAAALIVPLIVSRSLLIREAPLSMLAVLLFAYFVTGGLARWEGFVMLAALAAALSWIIIGGVGQGGLTDAPARTGAPPVGGSVGAASEIVDETAEERLGAHAVRTLIGLIGTVAGAQLLVWGATALASEIGLTGGFVGFTLVAVGTSLPELVTAVMAARRGATELLLGNLLGSNMFNSLAVGGLIAVLGPGPVTDEGLRTVGLATMVVVAVGAWVAMATLRRVHRIEAVLLLGSWVVAVALLARTATSEAAGRFLAAHL